jgi:4-hydroxyphenylpyruvate dioxygenase
MPAIARSVESVEKNIKIELEGYDYVRLLVGNAYQVAHFLCTVYGFRPIAYSGLETGNGHDISYALAQGDVRLVVTSPLDPSSPMADAVKLHGDSVTEIAFTVRDAEEVFNLALLRGGSAVEEPFTVEDELGKVTTASIRSVGGFVHSFVQRNGYTGAFLPGFQASDANYEAASAVLLELDHVALSVPAGELDEIVKFYTSVLDLEVTHEENIVTKNSAMNSKVVQSASGTIRFPIMEPAPAPRRSQIEEYLKYHHGPGVQHLAFSSHNLVEAVLRMQNAGAEFLRTPATYYDLLAARVGSISQDAAALRKLNILVDRDEWGYLLQIFSKPITGRPTLFLELIQREGARGFGSGNIRALFEAVEREQALRGNL